MRWVLCLILCALAGQATAAPCLEVFGAIGYSGVTGASLVPPSGLTLQAGVGYHLKRSTSLELIAGHLWLGKIYYSYGGVGDLNSDSRVTLVPITLNVTQVFRTQLPYPYVTLGGGLYALHYDRIHSDVPNEWTVHPGINGGLGFKGPPDKFEVRLDFRAHFSHLNADSQPRYDLARRDEWMRVLVIALGVQFP